MSPHIADQQCEVKDYEQKVAGASPIKCALCAATVQQPQKRGRGYWSVEDRRVEECGYWHGSGLVPAAFRNAEEWQEERVGVECPRCRGSCITLKALKLASNGEIGT